MRSRAVWMFLIAILLAVGAAWLANRWLESARLSAERPVGATQSVVVAATVIPFATKIEAVHLKTVQWPLEGVPVGTFNDPAQAIGKVANQTILTNEAVLNNRVAEHIGGSTLSAFIERSKRAVSIPVNAVTGVAGFVLPGNLIDILQTREGGTRTLLESIKVLAVDQEASPDKTKPDIVKAVTLELTPEQVETIVSATQTGSLHLALRNPLDSRPVVQPLPPPPVATTPPPVQSAPPPPKQPEQRVRHLTVIRGDHIKVYEGR